VNLLLFGQEQLAMSAMGWALESCGHQVTIAGRVEEFLARVGEDRPEICIVWDDLTSDEHLVAIADARRAHETTVVVLTGCMDMEQRTRAVDAGAVVCVDKATGFEQLLAIIASARARRKGSKMPPLVQAPVVERTGLERYLTPQELEALRGMVHGESTSQIAARLGVRSATARTHIQNVLMKLGVSSRVAAVAYAVEHKVVDLEPPTSPWPPSR
jgi:DNA-binding NarL/FixJ family response regulator